MTPAGTQGGEKESGPDRDTKLESSLGVEEPPVEPETEVEGIQKRRQIPDLKTQAIGVAVRGRRPKGACVNRKRQRQSPDAGDAALGEQEATEVVVHSHQRDAGRVHIAVAEGTVPALQAPAEQPEIRAEFALRWDGARGGGTGEGERGESQAQRRLAPLDLKRVPAPSGGGGGGG